MDRRARFVEIVLLTLVLLAGWPLSARAARAGADLVVKKTADTRTAQISDIVTYMITLTNRGPDAVTNVLLREGHRTSWVRPPSTAVAGRLWVSSPSPAATRVWRRGIR